MCAPTDGDVDARPGQGSTSLTAVQASELQHYYLRVKAIREPSFPQVGHTGGGARTNATR